MRNKTFLGLGIAIVMLVCTAGPAPQAPEYDYELFPGDFNGDGRTDILYVAATPDRSSGIALADQDGIPRAGFQTLHANQFGLAWSLDQVQPVVGDFNGDALDDVLLQSRSLDASYVMLANANPKLGSIGQLIGINQEIGSEAMGLEWSAVSHRLLAADFNGDRKDDLLLQATGPSGVSAIVLADSRGALFTARSDNCWKGGPHRCWANGELDLNWDGSSATIEVGDFNGDGKADMLVQAWPVDRAAGVDGAPDELSYPAKGFATVFSGGMDESGRLQLIANQRWDVDGLSTNWSPLLYSPIVADFSGDGHDDVFLQALHDGTPNQLVLADSKGSLQDAAPLANEAADWSSDKVRLVKGLFGNSRKAGLHLQWADNEHLDGIATNINDSIVSFNSANIPVQAAAGSADSPSGGKSHAPRGRGAGTLSGDPGGGVVPLAAVIPPLPTTAIGATPATADVTQNGSAAYTIPIKLPRGTAGLTPDLALSYSSSSENGLVGIGWNLTGLGIVSRCPRTLAQDGQTSGVQLVTADQYCLNGNRLRLVSGSQGQAGSVYRTELETYARTTAQGTGTQGPGWFKVETKDGLIYEYGNSATSRIGVTGNASITRAWALSKVSDRAGNYWTVTYVNDVATTGSYRPDYIDYTTNPAAQPATAPYRIKFGYGNRNTGENVVSYYMGGLINQTKRLASVELWTSGGVALVHKYVLTYPQPASTFNPVSRLASVQECSASGACMAPTTFTWSDQPLSNGAPTFGSPAGVAVDNAAPLPYTYSSITNRVVLDINGDGIPDVITRTDTNAVHLHLGVPKGVSPSAPVAYAISGMRPPAVDWDGDGKSDLLSCPTGGILNSFHQRSDGTYGLDSLGIACTSAPAGYTVDAYIDVDGDGFKDAISITAGSVSPSGPSGNVRVWFHRRDAVVGFESAGWQVAWTPPSGTKIASVSAETQMIPYLERTLYQAADIDGNGMQDLLVQMRTGGWRVLYSTGTAFTTGELLATTYIPEAGSYSTPLAIDMNGDGCTDLVYLSSGSKLATSRCRVVSGVGLNAAVASAAGSGTVVDANHDGLQDIFSTNGYSSGGTISLSTGVNFASPITLPNVTLQCTPLTPNCGLTAVSALTDYNGDQLPDASVACGPPYLDDPYNPCWTLSFGFVSGLGAKPNLLLSATDGFGKQVQFSYSPMTEPGIYSRGTTGVGKSQDLGSTMYVVKTMSLSDGIGGTYSLNYTYSGAKRNIAGRGFLGFAGREWSDSRTGFVTLEIYNNTVNDNQTDWERVGTLASRTVYQYKNGSSYGPKVEEVTQNWTSIDPDSTGNRRYPYVSSAVARRYELSGLLVTTTTTNTTIDNYGTPYVVNTTTAEGASGPGVHTRNVYIPPAYILNDTVNWCLARPQRIEDTRSHNLTNGGAVMRVNTQTWDAAKCRVTSTTEAPGSGQQLVTTLEYDGFGNIWRTTVSGDGIPVNRQPFTESSFGTNGHLLQSQTVRINGVNRTTSFGWDVPLGVRTSQTDPNNLSTTWQYDDFGREKLMVRPDLTKVETLYYVCDASNGYCGDGLLRYVVRKAEKQVNNTEINHVDQFFDVLGRVKYQQSIGFGKAPGAPELIETKRVFDNRGNLLQESAPYYMSDAPILTTTDFDYLNRPWRVQRATSDGNGTLLTDTFGYNGLTVSRTDPLGKVQTSVSTAWGTISQATDAAGKNTWYTYNSFGDLRSSTDPAGNVTQMNYNVRGFKTSMNDPDMGSWSYAYDGLGRLLTQTDAKSQTSSFTYDELSRTETREDYPGGAVNRTTWTWDSATKGIGQLGAVSSPGGYTENYSYDTYGKQSQVVTVPGAGNGSFTMSFSYDSQLGLPLQVTYPSSTGAQPVAVRYQYQNGIAKSVTDWTTGAAGTVYWTAQSQDARGHVNREGYGNGQITNLGFDRTNGRLYTIQTGPSGGVATQNLAYNWDGVGNLSTRQDLNQSLTETLTYNDNLYRLTSAQRNGDTPVTLTYNDIGNITSKSDVGSYTYPVSGGGSVRPHAVSSAGGLSYSYDANGNMTSRNGASVVWSSFNYPTTINQSGGNTSSFYYGPDRQLYRQISVDGAVTEDRITVGGGAFEKLIRGGQIEYRHFVQVAGKAVAVVKRSDQTGNATYYLHEDHLGSTDVITDQGGSVVVRLSFDAWGKRRGSNWTGNPSAADKTAISATTHLGYTGHEQLDNLNLVHMKGRVYDPILARFLSADPVIQDPFHSQAFNRYSYIWNNPLNGTDPAGFAGQDANKSVDTSACTASHISRTQMPNQDCYLTGGESNPIEEKGSGRGETQGGPNAARDPEVKSAEKFSDDKLRRGSLEDKNHSDKCGHFCKAGRIVRGFFSASVNDMVESALEPLNESLRTTIGGEFVGPFAPPETNEDQLGADLSPILGIAALVVTKSPKGLGANAARAVTPGSFNLINWAKYPSWAPKPTGTLRVLSGAEYDAARKAANAANAALRRADPAAYAGKQIHEIIPVKFGGSPTDLANKMTVTPAQHADLTNFWNQLMRDLP